MEAVNAKRNRGLGRESESESDSNRHVTDDSTVFQLLSTKLDEIVKRLDTLERDRVGNSSTEDVIIPELRTNTSLLQSQLSNNSTDNTSIASGSNNAGIAYIIQPIVAKPTFSGRDDLNPMRFIKKLKSYINAINGHGRALEIALECLTGSALKILGVHSEKWECLSDFERDFQKAFWGDSQQERAKYKLINSAWNPRVGISMSEHFAEQIESVKFLTIPLSETEMVNCVIKHFPVDVQKLWFTRKVEATISSAADFLTGLEQNVVTRTPYKHFID